MKRSALLLFLLVLVVNLGLATPVAPKHRHKRARVTHRAASSSTKKAKVELRKINSNLAPGVNAPQGTSSSGDGQERNRRKNRHWSNVTAPATTVYDCNSFVTAMNAVDSSMGNPTSRTGLSSSQRALLDSTEANIVSLDGYAAYGYAGPPEDCNSGSKKYHDWHMEILPMPIGHAYANGDPTPVICEVTPITERRLYDSGVRLQPLFGFSRWDKGMAGFTMKSNGHVPHKVRITGYLLWDNAHVKVGEVGTTLSGVRAGKLHKPWRASAWEIHPVLKIEDLGP